VEGETDWSLPALGPWMLDLQAGWRLPGVAVTGYDYDAADQPVLLEVWIEKSTMDDVLVPLCRDLHANLLSGSGFTSITTIIALLRRAERHGKPAHVLHVADFDPAGVTLAVAVARQAEFWREKLGITAELTIEQVALTAEQVAAYRLPRIPIKKGDTRGANFEARNGEGAVELDALEALHPGVLAETVRHAANPYVDLDLRARLLHTERNAQVQTSRQWRDATAGVRGDLAELEADVHNVVGRYRERLNELGRELAADLLPYQ